MNWNIAAECMSVVTLIIIWTYSFKSNLIPSLKNKLFKACLFVTFLGMISNILSTVMIFNYQIIPLWMIWLVTTLYFIFTPLMSLFYVLYSASIIYEDLHKLKTIITPLIILGMLYTIVILINPFTKNIFNISMNNGYVTGDLIIITYIIFYIYCFIAIIIALINRKKLDRQIRYILSSFPIIAIVVIIIQQFYPSVILSGSAATAALLIIYLHLQNKQISMDYLTNLPNRLSLLDSMELLIKNRNEFTICVISLRSFKQINDFLGQQNGDFLLKELSHYLQVTCKPHAVFRFKGDEFAILIRNSDIEKIESLLEVINQKIIVPWNIKNMQCHLSCVIGVINYPNSALTIENLIYALEAAISIAKDQKEGNICYCDKEIFNQIQRKNKIIEILKEKIETRDFEMYYQPIISLDTKKFLYAESLMRIQDSPLGPLSPGEFIPIGEEAGLIVDLTYIILDKVCAFIEDIVKQGIVIEAIHVNFSALQFHQPNLIDEVLSIINSYTIPASAIKLEFTESTVAKNTEIVTEFALAMKKHGVLMGLDDFGTGYSNLSTVVDIPFSTVKLDKSLIWSALQQNRFATTVKNIIKMFKDLNMSVVAEGVETKEQNDFITKSGVDQIQGFYYAKPMNAQDTKDFLLKQQANTIIDDNLIK